MKGLYVLLIASAFALRSNAQDQPTLITLPGTGTTGSRAIIGLPEGGFMLVSAPSAAGTTFIRTTASGAPIDAFASTEAFSRVVLCSDSGFLMLSHVFFQYTALVRTDKDLNVLWAERMAAAPLGYMPQDIAERDGAHYLVGTVQQGVVAPDLALYGTWAAVVHKLDATGALVDQCIVSDTVHDPYRYGLLTPRLALAADGSLFMATSMLPQALAGTCNRQPAVIKLNSDLDLLWCKRYPVTSYNEASGISVLANGDLALSGHYTSNPTPCSNARLFLDRLDTSGAILHAHAYRHSFQSSTGFGPATELPDGTFMLAHNHQDTAFGAAPFFDHLDPTGVVLGSSAYHRAGTNANMRLASDGGGAIAAFRLNSADTLLFTPVSDAPATYCYSVANTTLDSAITVEPQPYTLSDHLTYPFVLADTLLDPFTVVPMNVTIDCDISTTVPLLSESEWNVHPVPSNGAITVVAPSAIDHLVITDALGRVVHLSRPRTATVSLVIHDPGMYFMRIINGEVDHVRKLIIEGR